MTVQGYDDIAEWYEHDFLGGVPETDSIGIVSALESLLGEGSGKCLDIGCGTGAYSSAISALGWSPIGVDLSMGMLAYAKGRLPVSRADGASLPFADASFPRVVTTMVHTDTTEYQRMLDEVGRVLEADGVLVHVGVHPCFCGAFADRGDPAAVVVGPGYSDATWTTDSWTDRGVRDKVGAAQYSLPALLHAFLDVGLALEGFVEGGGPVPVTLAVKARKKR